jgi:branched-chain amino acid transport system substrate-binding protein
MMEKTTMKRLHRTLLLVLTIALAPGIAPARVVAEESGISGESEVVIGVPLPLTGKLQEFGLMMRRSFDMAKEVINAAGGIDGRPLRLVYSDDQGSVDRARAVIEELTEKARAVMLVGGYQSDATYALAQLANRRDIPFLVCTAATDRITEQGWRNVYRLNPPVSEYTSSLEDYLLKELHPKSMAVVYEDSMFGTDAAAKMMSFLQDNGIEIGNLIGYSAERADPVFFRSLLAPLTREPPDAIHMIAYLADGIALVKAIRELGIPSQPIGAAAGFTHPKFLAHTGEAANGLLVATLWSDELPYPGAEKYSDAYLAAYGAAPDYHGAEAYSALLVAAAALKRASTLEPGAIRKALDETSIMTPFGPVRFYSYENFERQNSVRTQVLRVEDGRFQVVWPADLATASGAP